MRGRKNYATIYNNYIEKDADKLSLLSNFLMDVKNISPAAYEFLCEGYDIINLKALLNFKDKTEQEIINLLFELKSFSIFIEHAFMKILKETDVNRKLRILCGLMGL